jgi:hypothetical protein
MSACAPRRWEERGRFAQERGTFAQFRGARAKMFGCGMQAPPTSRTNTRDARDPEQNRDFVRARPVFLVTQELRSARSAPRAPTRCSVPRATQKENPPVESSDSQPAACHGIKPRSLLWMRRSRASPREIRHG